MHVHVNKETIGVSRFECKRKLRSLEIKAYSNVVDALRAQGKLTNNKHELLKNLANCLRISEDHQRTEIRRAANNEILNTISQCMVGRNTEKGWLLASCRSIPIKPMVAAHTAFTPLADNISDMMVKTNSTLTESTSVFRKAEKLPKRTDEENVFPKYLMQFLELNKHTKEELLSKIEDIKYKSNIDNIRNFLSKRIHDKNKSTVVAKINDNVIGNRIGIFPVSESSSNNENRLLSLKSDTIDSSSIILQNKSNTRLSHTIPKESIPEIDHNHVNKSLAHPVFESMVSDEKSQSVINNLNSKFDEKNRNSSDESNNLTMDNRLLSEEKEFDGSSTITHISTDRDDSFSDSDSSKSFCSTCSASLSSGGEENNITIIHRRFGNYNKEQSQNSNENNIVERLKSNDLETYKPNFINNRRKCISNPSFTLLPNDLENAELIINREESNKNLCDLDVKKNNKLPNGYSNKIISDHKYPNNIRRSMRILKKVNYADNVGKNVDKKIIRKRKSSLTNISSEIDTSEFIDDEESRVTKNPADAQNFDILKRRSSILPEEEHKRKRRCIKPSLSDKDTKMEDQNSLMKKTLRSKPNRTNTALHRVPPSGEYPIIYEHDSYSDECEDDNSTLIPNILKYSSKINNNYMSLTEDAGNNLNKSSPNFINDRHKSHEEMIVIESSDSENEVFIEYNNVDNGGNIDIVSNENYLKIEDNLFSVQQQNNVDLICDDSIDKNPIIELNGMDIVIPYNEIKIDNYEQLNGDAIDQISNVNYNIKDKIYNRLLEAVSTGSSHTDQIQNFSSKTNIIVVDMSKENVSKNKSLAELLKDAVIPKKPRSDNDAVSPKNLSSNNDDVIPKKLRSDNDAIITKKSSSDNDAVILENSRLDNDTVILKKPSSDNDALILKKLRSDNDAIIPKKSSSDSDAVILEKLRLDNEAVILEKPSSDNDTVILEKSRSDNDVIPNKSIYDTVILEKSRSDSDAVIPKKLVQSDNIFHFESSKLDEGIVAAEFIVDSNLNCDQDETNGNDYFDILVPQLLENNLIFNCANCNTPSEKESDMPSLVLQEQDDNWEDDVVDMDENSTESSNNEASLKILQSTYNHDNNRHLSELSMPEYLNNPPINEFDALAEYMRNDMSKHLESINSSVDIVCSMVDNEINIPTVDIGQSDNEVNAATVDIDQSFIPYETGIILSSPSNKEHSQTTNGECGLDKMAMCSSLVMSEEVVGSGNVYNFYDDSVFCDVAEEVIIMNGLDDLENCDYN